MTASIAEAFYKEIPPKMIQEAMTRIPEEMRSIVHNSYQMLGTQAPDDLRTTLPADPVAPIDLCYFHI